MTSVVTIDEARRIDALEKIYRFSDFEKRRQAPYNSENYSLNHITKILELLGNPQNHFQSFHIAGTKGKGTTTYLIAYLLEEMGYVTGHVVSPQLIDERDRFYIRGQRSTWEELIPVVEEVMEMVDKAVEDEEIRPTVFDIFTAIAFQFFRRSGVEIAVVETGLGGRWDSTNCLTSANLNACLITRIDYDHMDKLGNTLPLIAGEKAGIIKPGVPVFTLNNNPGVVEVIRAKTKEQGSPLYFVGVDCHYEQIKKSFEFIPKSTQANLDLAVTCLTTLKYPLTDRCISQAVKKLPIPGRYQKIENLLIDGAHTSHSLKSLIIAIKTDPWTQSFSEVKVFFYCLYDKNVERLVREIPFKWEMFFFDCDLPYLDPLKVLKVKKVADRVRGGKLKVVKSLAELKWLEHPQVLHVFLGSFRLVGKVLQELEKST